MDQKQLLAFYYTATLGSALNASIKLKVSPSAITKLIKHLEEEVGHKLFSKKGKNLALIPKGEIFLQTVKTIFAEYETCLARMEKSSNKMEEKFSLGIPDFISNSGFINAITPFIQRHPYLSLEIKTLTQAPDLNEKKIDINISPILATDENIIAKYLISYDIGLYASKSYLQEKAPITQISDLEAHQLISFSKDYLFPYVPMNWPFNQIFEPKHKIVFGSLMGIAQAIENGLGIGPLPQTIANVNQASLIPILPELNYSLDIYYMYPKVLSKTLLANELYKYLHTQPGNLLKGRIKK